MIPTLYKKEILTLSPAELHEHACSFAEQQFAKDGKAPFLWLLQCEHQVIWIETAWEDEREKQVHTMMIAELLQTFKVSAYSCMTEAWLAQQDPRKKLVMPSERAESERDDVLMIVTQERDKPVIFTHYKVTIRPPGRGMNFLGPRQDDLVKGFSGAMVNLFAKSRLDWL